MKQQLVILASLGWLSISPAASFDCNKATTLVETTICSESTLSSLDDELTQQYQRAIAHAQNAAELKNRQKEWLKQVRNKCQTVDCLLRSYQARIAALTTHADMQETAVTPSVAALSIPLTGWYEYAERGYSGTMQLSEISACDLSPLQPQLGCHSSTVLVAKISTINVSNAHDCDLDVVENTAGRITQGGKISIAWISREEPHDTNFTMTVSRNGAQIEPGDISGCGLHGSIVGKWKRSKRP